jgi:hypothetical protein
MKIIDLAELDVPDTIKLEFPDASNILNFNVTIHPDEGKNMKYINKRRQSTTSKYKICRLLY